ncbi:hypothetical protein Tco_0152387 [Tanacetum coccineum]
MELPMVEKSKTDEDKDGKAVIPSNYQWYVCHPFFIVTPVYCPTFAICMCARYQARPTEKHLNAVKRIFWYLKGTVHRGLWYPKDSFFALTAFADADHLVVKIHAVAHLAVYNFGDSTWIWSSKSRKALRYPDRLMEISIADQIALDDALVAPADRLKIGKCNLRLSSDVTSKEATLQVVYDVLKLTPFYKAFQVTTDAPKIYMQEF